MLTTADRRRNDSRCHSAQHINLAKYERRLKISQGHADPLTPTKRTGKSIFLYNSMFSDAGIQTLGVVMRQKSASVNASILDSAWQKMGYSGGDFKSGIKQA